MDPRAFLRLARRRASTLAIATVIALSDPAAPPAPPDPRCSRSLLGTAHVITVTTSATNGEGLGFAALEVFAAVGLALLRSNSMSERVDKFLKRATVISVVTLSLLLPGSRQGRIHSIGKCRDLAENVTWEEIVPAGGGQLPNSASRRSPRDPVQSGHPGRHSPPSKRRRGDAAIRPKELGLCV